MMNTEDINLERIITHCKAYFKRMLDKKEPLQNKAGIFTCFLLTLYFLHQIEFTLKSFFIFIIKAKLATCLLVIVFLVVYAYRRELINALKQIHINVDLIKDPMITNAAVFMGFAAFLMIAYARFINEPLPNQINSLTPSINLPAKVYLEDNSSLNLANFDDFNRNLQSLIKNLSKKFELRKKPIKITKLVTNSSNLPNVNATSNVTSSLFRLNESNVTITTVKQDKFDYIDNETIALYELLDNSLPMFLNWPKKNVPPIKEHYFARYELKFKTLNEFLKFVIRSSVGFMFLLTGFYLVIKTLELEIGPESVNEDKVEDVLINLPTFMEISCQVQDTDFSQNGSDADSLIKKRNSYIKNQPAKTSINRLSLKGKKIKEPSNRANSISSNSFEMLSNAEFNNNNYNEDEVQLNSSLDDLKYLKFDDGEILDHSNAAQSTEQQPLPYHPLEQDEFITRAKTEEVVAEIEGEPEQIIPNSRTQSQNLLTAQIFAELNEKKESLLHTQAITDLLIWLLFTDLDNFSAKSEPDYTGLINWLIEDYLNSVNLIICLKKSKFETFFSSFFFFSFITRDIDAIKIL